MVPKDRYDQYDHNAMSVKSSDLKGNFMILQTNAVNFRQNLGEMLNQVQYRRDSVIINKDGKPVAALVDARLFNRIQRMYARFQALSERIEAGFSRLDPALGMAEIDAVIAEERRGKIR